MFPWKIEIFSSLNAQDVTPKQQNESSLTECFSHLLKGWVISAISQIHTGQTLKEIDLSI
jgi:hypothetical protein